MKTEPSAQRDDRPPDGRGRGAQPLDGILYQSEKMLRENREKIAEADVKKAEEAIEDAKKAITKAAWRGYGRPRKRRRSLHKTPKNYTRRRKRRCRGAGRCGGGAGAGGGFFRRLERRAGEKAWRRIDAE